MSDYDPIENLTRELDSTSRARTGEAWDPRNLLENLPHYNLEERAEVLKQFDIVLDHMDTSDLRRFSELSSLRKRADDVHHTMRKAGR
jgi:hypothetical protein